VETGFRVVETLFSKSSPYQRVEVFRTAGHGAMLVNDGVAMVCERDAFVYHEMIAHVPLFCHPEPREILIVGGGDGGTAVEVLRHPSIERVVVVEIDAVVVEACRRHLPGLAAGFDDPRVELRIEDGIRFVERCPERFDVVIVDSSDPQGPAEGLFDRAFYGAAASRLKDKGILVTQAASPFYDTPLQRTIFESQRPFFQRLHLYLYGNLTYPGGLWAFGFASSGVCPLAGFDARRAAAAGLDLRYYNPRIHRAAFMLPEFVHRALGDLLDPLPPHCP
jgi:spermidine synthase